LIRKRKEILNGIARVLSSMEVLEEDDHFDEDTGLLGMGIGLDSVEIIQLVAGLEEEFNLTIDDDDLVPDHFFTIGSLASFLAGDYLR